MGSVQYDGVCIDGAAKGLRQVMSVPYLNVSVRPEVDFFEKLFAPPGGVPPAREAVQTEGYRFVELQRAGMLIRRGVWTTNRDLTDPATAAQNYAAIIDELINMASKSQ